MFLRFSKGFYDREREKYLYEIRKSIFLGDSVIMEYGDKIVGIAKLHEETDKYLDYDIVVANRCTLGAANIVRFIKDMINKSNKFSINPSLKRRKYCVEEFDGESLPIEAKIVFTHK